MKYFAIYLLIVNAIGFLLMLIDKRKAIRRRWRIREKTLFLTAAIGGSIGSIMGMYTFRHKTKHLQFTLGMPAILIVQLVLAFVFFTRIYPL
jgi:uncharacterized membrane protein YsdA (DUF1294 family)